VYLTNGIVCPWVFLLFQLLFSIRYAQIIFVINPTKTSIAHSKMDFLDHTISEEGICIAPSKIRAFERIQPPKSRKSLQRLLGLLNFFRKHIPNFSQRTVNTRQLLKQDVKFDWSSKCDEELSSLKQALIANPIFQPLQPTKLVYIYIDAATSGYGSAIIQFKDSGVPNDCAYLTPSLMHRNDSR